MGSTLSFRDLIGKPFAWGGRGPDSYDCYGLVSEMLSRCGQSCPDYRSPDCAALVAPIITSVEHQWTPCEPRRGAIALMQFARSMHVAFILDNRRLIHTWEGAGGVLVEPLSEWRKRIKGYYFFEGRANA